MNQHYRPVQTERVGMNQHYRPVQPERVAVVPPRITTKSSDVYKKLEEAKANIERSKTNMVMRTVYSGNLYLENGCVKNVLFEYNKSIVIL
jgi:hypothetical protein